MPKLARTLLERRVPHILALYAGASWGLVEFVNFAVDEFLLSPHWIRVALVALLLLFPSVFMLAWFHGKPGKDVDEMPRTEKIGIPVNFVVCGTVLWALFGGEDLGAATTSITVENEDGEVVERDVAKPEFRKRTILFPLDPGDGLGEEESWLAYAVPGALAYDLSPDEFFEPILVYALRDRLEGLGFPDLLGIPTALKRELSEEVFWRLSTRCPCGSRTPWGFPTGRGSRTCRFAIGFPRTPRPWPSTSGAMQRCSSTRIWTPGSNS